MKSIKTSTFFSTIIGVIMIFTNSFSQRDEIAPPVAKKHPEKLTIHNHTRTDNYFWLRERENPEVIKYLEKENEYTKAVMKDSETLQEKLFNEITGRIKKDDSSVPYLKNGYYYYNRYESEKEFPVYCRKAASPDAVEKVILDVNILAKGLKYYQAVGLSVSPDNNILAFGEDTLSRRKYDILFKDLKTGQMLPDRLTNTTGSTVWANDNKTVFYVRKDDALRAYKIFKHKLGNDPKLDEEVYHESDETFSTYVFKTKSEKYIVIGSYSTLSNEYRFLDANNTEGEFILFCPREREHEYSINHLNDKFYISTNFNAKNFRLMETDESKTAKENWKDIIPHRDDVLLEGFELFNDYLVLQERKNGLTRIRIKRWDGKSDKYLEFDEETYSAFISANYEAASELLRYDYSSLTTPNSVFDYNMRTGEKILLKQDEVLGDFNIANYHSERIYAKAKDGVEIPVSLVYRKDMKNENGNPLLLYGYGSYGISMNPSFNSAVLSLLDRGFIYAIAHIRGGEELGRQWYEDGKLLKKKNTFTDFISCAEFLIEKKYTGTDKLFIMGGSAGGLLIGAVLNMRPDLFKGALAIVPFVDVVTTMLDESIPLTTVEYDEWGNPNIKEYYDYMLSYSPYDNVEAKNYPDILVMTGLHDSQVQYWEPAKWVAKLREMKTDNNMLLLHTNMDAGHSGASGRFRKFKETALEYAFILNLTGSNK
jgi:oligopeptidase B